MAAMVWSLVGIAILAWIALRLMGMVRDVIPPLVLALALIFLLNPIVSALERRGVPRAWGTLAAYLLAIGLLLLVGLLLLPPLGRQLQDLVSRLPEVGHRLSQLAGDLSSRLGLSLEADPQALFQRFGGEIRGAAGTIAGITKGALHVVLIFVLAPIVALYLLIDLPRLQASFVDYLPARYRKEWVMLLERCGEAVGGFFRGQLLVAMIVGLLSSAALWAIKVPAWLAIGLLAGLSNLIPLVGPFIGGGLAVGVGALDGGLTKAALAAVAMFVVQQVDNHFISPNVMGRAMKLHPVAVMVALLAGGAVGGLWGMLLAVPTTAVLKILVLHYYTTHVLHDEAAHVLTVPAGAGSLGDAEGAETEERHEALAVARPGIDTES